MDMVSGRIAAVLDARRSLAPAVEREIAFWEGLALLLADLDKAVRGLREADPDGGVVAEIAGLDVAELMKVIAQTLASWAAVRARVSRNTINIGVSGRARNGKSTLLQSLSGLGDEQIPTGRGLAVTAVRSIIYHSLVRSQALLTMHTESSFCEEVITPYHDVLELPAAPRTIDDFAAFAYPQTAEKLPGGVVAQPKSGPMLARLREMQASLPAYRRYLTGEPRQVALSELRSWVAYPASDDGDPVPARRYLAVRHAEVTSRFPIDDVIDLALIDLPGLGELVPHAEERHLAGLVNEVDFVLVVKRPTDTNAMWTSEDGDALKLIALASGAASVRDFMAVLVNSGDCLPENLDALKTDLTKRLNEGLGGGYYRIITADAADRDAVRDQVLTVVLDHLAAALPQMDAAVIGHARSVAAASRERLLTAVTGALTALASVTVPTPAQELNRRARRLRTETAKSLQEWIGQLKVRAEADYEDKEFYSRAAEIQAAAREWVMDGFGKGRDAWIENARDEIQLNLSVFSLVESTFNTARVEISQRFAVIDDLLLRRREQFWEGLMAALGSSLGGLIEHDEAAQALRGLAARLRWAPNPCGTLADSLDAVLDVRLDYRTRVLPEVRRALRVLYPRGAEVVALADIPPSGDGAGELFTAISNMSRQVVQDAGSVLAQEPGTTAQVLLAYGEQFEDSFIRSQRSEDDFLSLAEAFKDQLWPAQTSGPAVATARVQQARAALIQLKQALGETTVTSSQVIR